MIYFHSFRSPGLVIDIVQDIRNINELSRKSRKAGMIILGGGICKHQIANAMLIVSFFIYLMIIRGLRVTIAQRIGLLCLHCMADTGRVRELSLLISHLQNTGQEFDGSDSGARPDEAVSWGKIRAGSESVKVYSTVDIVSTSA
jgi:deoxyhypusine synthase